MDEIHANTMVRYDGRDKDCGGKEQSMMKIRCIHRKRKAKSFFGMLVFLFFAFSSPGRAQINDLQEIQKIGKLAQNYRLHSQALGGGEGSYAGFTLPQEYAGQNVFTLYEIFPEKIVVQVNPHTNRPVYFWVIDSAGNTRGTMSACDYGLDRIGRLAYQYRSRYASEGGGGGSYRGFVIPDTYKVTSLGSYSISSIQENEIVVTGFDTTSRKIFKAIYLANGKRFYMNDYFMDVKKIQSIAYQYKTRPSSEGGGQGSYIGFTLPKDLDSTSYGKYLLYDIQPDEFVLKVLPRTSRDWYLFVFDSLGKPKYDGFQQHSGDVFWENYRAIIADMKIIGWNAANYWRKTKPSRSLRSSFDGFMIPDTLAKTVNASYTITEVRDDTLYIRAVSSKGYGEEYFLINAQGNERLLIFGEYRPPKVQPKRIMRDDAQTMYKHADEHLNEIYQQLLVRKKSDKRFIKNLRTAEQLWIKYRNAQFKERYPQQNLVSDGCKLTKSQLGYLTFLTEKRITALQELFDQP
ncbi:MAG: lysozyme inhibitor LprI family protein [Bacteroidota bacterium]|jgi:uncharacterized protein YecT (DUF1311 family)